MKKDDRPFWTSESFAQWGRRRSPPFGAREGGIHERLVQVRLSALMQAPRQSPERLFQYPAPHPLLESAGAGLERRVPFWQFRHCAPVPKTHSTPCKTARVSCHGRPRLSARRFGRCTALPLTLPTAGYLPSIMKCPKLYKELTDRYAVPAKNRLRSASDRFAASGADWPRIFALQKKKAHVHVAVTIRRLLIF